MLSEKDKVELGSDIWEIFQNIYDKKQLVKRFTPGNDPIESKQGGSMKRIKEYGSNGPDTAGFKSFGEFLYTVKSNPQDIRLKALSEGVDSLGGFLVPEITGNAILADVLEESLVRKYATVLPMTSDTLKVPRIVDTSHSSSLYGGIVCYWTEEAGEKTAKEPTFGSVKLIAKKLTGYTYASDELLADSAVALGMLLEQLFAGSIAFYEDYAFLRGSGVGEPLGIFGSGAVITPNRKTASKIALEDLANMWARLLPQSTSRAIWIANPSTIAELCQLATTSLTWLSIDAGVANSPPARLLGRPLLLSEKVPALGTTGDIGLYDLSYYLIGDRSKLKIDSSTSVRFTTDETAWRFVERVDGQPWVDSPLTPKNGSTLSPFVQLSSATA